MFVVTYTYSTGHHGQRAHATRYFATQNEAINYASRMDSTPGIKDVAAWVGAKKLY
jgi:hypothetical protein